MPDPTPTQFLMPMLEDVYPEQDKQWPIFGSDEFLDRDTVVTASEATNCTRRLYYEKRAKELRNPDFEDTWGYGVRGHAVEDWVINQIEEALLDDDDMRLINVGANQVSYLDPSKLVSGTPDGVLLSQTGFSKGLEVKSFDPRTNSDRFPKDEHVAQLQVNMELVQRIHPTAAMASGILTYINASDFSDVHEFHVGLSSTPFEIALSKSKAIRKAKKPEDLSTTMNPTQCKFCAFSRHCGTINGKKKKPAAPKWPEQFKDTKEKTLYEDFLQVREKRDKIAIRYEELENRVKADLSRRKKAVWVGDVQLGYAEQEGRKMLSKRLIEEAGLNPEEYTETGAPHSRLYVSKAPPKEG